MCEDYHVQVMHFMSTLDLLVLYNEYFINNRIIVEGVFGWLLLV
jgi:hypothetical protein